MNLIEPHLGMLHDLTNAETFSFHRSILGRLRPMMIVLVRVKGQFDKYELVFVGYDNSFKVPAEAPETVKIKALDKLRRGVFIQIGHVVRDAAKYSAVPTAKAAAEALTPIFKNFAGTPQVEYEGEMANILNFIQDLEKPENAARIAILGQTENVAALKQINLDFQAIYTSRFESKFFHKQEGSSRQWRGKLSGEYSILCKILTGLRLSATDPDEIAALDEAINVINSTAEQFTTIVNRRSGMRAAKKKDKEKDNDKKDEGTETPGSNNPPAPDAPPQNPDTTLPAAPNIPNQNPAATPPQINPNDPNPPGMGKH